MELENNINSSNPGLKTKTLHKFPNSRTLKVTFDTREMALKCASSGLKLFCLYIPARRIEEEIFVPITFCYRCFAINDHMKRDCPHPDNYEICSLCSSLSHTYRDCKELVRKCVNCQGNHSTLAPNCPTRKKAIAAGRKQTPTAKHPSSSSPNSSASFSSSSFPSSSYSSALTKSTHPNPLPAVTRNDVLLTITSLMIAALKESQKSGSFKSVLDELFRVNNLPAFNMGNVEPPTSISPSDAANFFNTNKYDEEKTHPTPDEEEAPSTPNEEAAPPKSKTECILYKIKNKTKLTTNNIMKLRDKGDVFIHHINCSSSELCWHELTGASEYGAARLSDTLELEKLQYNSIKSTLQGVSLKTKRTRNNN